MGSHFIDTDGFSDTLDCLIIAFCRDFETRERAIEDKSCSKRTLMEYEYINRRIRDGAREVVGDQYKTYVREIGERIGYAYSEVDAISETEYKKRKKETKIHIAKKLHLLD